MRKEFRSCHFVAFGTFEKFADEMFRIMGWTKADFADVTEFSTRGQSKPFCEEKVDILIESIGLPAPLYDRLARDCGAKFIDMPERMAAAFRKSGPFFFDYESGQHQS